MDRSDLTRSLRQINGRTTVAVDLSEIEEEISQIAMKTETLSNNLAETDEIVGSLSNNLFY
jgi:hypothetical protein